jgi:stage III sporulation protein AA
MDSWALARSLLPDALSDRLEPYPKAEEIRLRTGRPPSVILGGRERVIDWQTTDRQLLLRVMEKATGASLHAAAPALRNGFINYRGIRIGVCGEAVFTGGTMSGLRGFSSLAIRVPHTLPSGCEELIEGLISPNPRNILIISPPGVGKTSFLRELIRQAASRAYRVSVIDERNELSASVSGTAQFDLGPGSDVMVGVPKAQAAIMLLRGMNPEIVAMDEITQREDIGAVEEIVGCGVRIFAAAHARDAGDLRKRPLYRALVSDGIFEELVTIRCRDGKRVYTGEALP